MQQVSNVQGSVQYCIVYVYSKHIKTSKIFLFRSIARCG
jgi:hypothetical protein